MCNPRSFQIAVLAVAIVFSLVTGPANAAKRIALLIGNSAYQHSGELENPENDASLIASALRQAGFEVTIRTNANLKSQNSLSNWAIGVGSATTIITAGILVSQNDGLIGSTAFDWMAVAGGVVTGYLAFKSSRVNREIRINPQSNFIRVIWTGENTNNLFPPATLYLLNQEYTEDGFTTTLRESIIEAWQESDFLLGDEENMLLMNQLLADEAIYDEAMLDLRMEMLETVDLGIDQINRALYLFNSKRY